MPLNVSYKADQPGALVSRNFFISSAVMVAVIVMLPSSGFTVSSMLSTYVMPLSVVTTSSAFAKSPGFSSVFSETGSGS